MASIAADQVAKVSSEKHLEVTSAVDKIVQTMTRFTWVFACTKTNETEVSKAPDKEVDGKNDFRIQTDFVGNGKVLAILGEQEPVSRGKQNYAVNETDVQAVSKKHVASKLRKENDDKISTKRRTTIRA